MSRFILFLFVIILLPLKTKGQASVSVDPLSFVLTGNPTQTDVYYHVHLTNTGSENVNIFWSKRMFNQPAQWTSWICDIDRCWDQSVNSCPADKPNVLLPGDSMLLQVHMRPFLTEGTGDYELNVLVDSTIIATVTGVFIIGSTTSLNEEGEASLIIYPNPTSDFFEIANNPEVKNIEVFNIIGNKVKSFDAAPNRQYYVSDLADGVYLVRLTSATKNVLQTVRLFKR